MSAPNFHAQALRAYGAVKAARSLREQEAEVYALVSGRLRVAVEGSDIERIRARSDATRLFSTVRVLTLHESCELPLPLRGQIVSVCRAAMREADKDDADLGFLADICDSFAAGLLGRAPAMETGAAA
ncbi:flagellar biosynthesis regulator FlaF [Roseomonas sp. 18066]|uniref:flagellar biosynthesis regulator FlaF n=1 Tax=Roseomonas sp. 18066 TaxID=2681412 RepID=UPI00135974B9|nr:flagellar biosynthesis regulator FlaF [Roseomonas sp. 18066]